MNKPILFTAVQTILSGLGAILMLGVSALMIVVLGSAISLSAHAQEVEGDQMLAKLRPAHAHQHDLQWEAQPLDHRAQGRILKLDEHR